MGFCLGLGKTFIYISGFVLMVLGIAAIAAGGWSLASEGTAAFDITNWNSTTSFGYSLIIAGLVLLVVSIAGFVGSKKQSKCCLLIFDIGMLVLFIFFFIIFCAAAVSETSWMNDLKASDACTTQDWLKSVNDGVNEVRDNLYGTQACVIYVKDQSKFATGTFDNLDTTTTEADGYDSAVKCISDNSAALDGEIDDSQVDWMTAMEQYFDCSGVCDDIGYYMFSDINSGVPSGDCKTALVDFVQKFMDITIIITGAISAWIFLTMLITCCVCCAAKRNPDNQGQGNMDLLHSAYNR